MKRKILALLLSLVLILPLCPAFELPLAMPASAEETEGAADAEGTTGACTWKLKGDVLTISGNGAMAKYTTTTNELSLLPVRVLIIENGVTAIGEYSFEDCTTLTTVALPKSVTNVKQRAFDGCTGIANVWYEGSESDKGNITFGSYNKRLSGSTWHYGACVNNMDGNWEHSYDNIVDDTCNLCSGQRTLDYDNYGTTGKCFWYVKDNVLTIFGDGEMGNYTKDKAPWGKAITEVVIEEGVTAIGNHTLYGTDITAVTIPDTVTTIGNRAFCNCDYLSSVIIGSSVTTIDQVAFGNCPALTSINIPVSVTSIGNLVFTNCTTLTKICYQGSEADKTNNITFDDRLGTEAQWYYNSCMENPDTWTHVYDDDDTDVECNSCGYQRTLSDCVHEYDNKVDATCNKCDYVRTLDYDNSGPTGDCFWYLEGTKLTIFGDGAMENYTQKASAPWGTSVTEVVIEEGVTAVGDRTFYECSSLSSIEFPINLISIGSRAFYNCSNLGSIVIPATVTTIDERAFRGCAAVTSLHIPASLTNIGEFAFVECTGITTITVEDGNATYRLEENCLIEKATDTIILGKGTIIPSSATSIAAFAFGSRTDLTSIRIPASIKKILNSAFNGCKNLTDVWYEGNEVDYADLEIINNNNSNVYFCNATWHFENFKMDSKVNLTVDERIYLNLWLKVDDVNTFKTVTGKDFTYSATMGERSLGEGTVTAETGKDLSGEYYVVRLDAVSANRFNQLISIVCPTGTINAVGNEDLTILSIATAGAAQYEDQKDLFTALYNYGASATGETLLPMENFVEDQKDNIQVTAKTNETASFQKVYLLMGDSIGIRLKGELTGDQEVLSVKVNGTKNNAYKLTVGTDGTLTIDLYVSADHFNTDLTIEVYSEGIEDPIASFIGSVKGYSEQIAATNNETLALAQFVQACVNFKAA